MLRGVPLRRNELFAQLAHCSNRCPVDLATNLSSGSKSFRHQWVASPWARFLIPWVPGTAEAGACPLDGGGHRRAEEIEDHQSTAEDYGMASQEGGWREPTFGRPAVGKGGKLVVERGAVQAHPVGARRRCARLPGSKLSGRRNEHGDQQD